MHIVHPIIRRNRTITQVITLIALIAACLSIFAALAAIGQQPAKPPTTPSDVVMKPKSPDSLLTVKLAARDVTVTDLNIQHLIDEANKQLVNLQNLKAQQQAGLDAAIAKVKSDNGWHEDVVWEAAREQFVKKPAVAAGKPVQPAAPHAEPTGNVGQTPKPAAAAK